MNKALLCLVIIGAAFATSTQDEVIATIKRIDSTKFGKTLMDTIQLQLQTNDPLDTLLETLTSLEDGLTADQKEDDSNNQEFQAACDSDIGALDLDIAQSTQKKTILEARLEGQLYPTQQILTQIVATKTKEAAAYQQDVNELDAERNESREEFEQKVDEHNEATAAIGEARRLFSEGFSAPSGQSVFLQGGKINAQATVSASTTALVQKHFLNAAHLASKNLHRKAYAKVFKVLATISSRAQQLADQGALGNLVNLIDQLLAKIDESLNLERDAESKRVSAYTKTRRLLVITLQIAQTALANTQTQLAGVEDQITINETSLDNTEQRLVNKNEERADRFEQCELAAQQYSDARSVRSDDRQTISDALGIINAQLRTLREQLALRVQAGDFE